jgi:hypothetical protein
METSEVRWTRDPYVILRHMYEKLKLQELGTFSHFSGFGGLGVSVLASVTQVRGFKPGRSRRIFKGGKILSTPSFGRQVKPWVPCRRCTVEVGI